MQLIYSTPTCNLCGEPVGEFRERDSMKEFTISGLCQECQDAIFSEEEAYNE